MEIDDIIARLRKKYSGQLPICIEAADEIERLRIENTTLRQAISEQNKINRITNITHKK
jgi:hypothetical protein